MKIVEKKLSDLKPYEKNPRKNDGAVKYVEKSIKEFGFRVPIIIDKDNVIVAGHTRYKAAQNLKMEKVPCIVASDLTEKQIKAYRLADNKVSEFSVWDYDLLSEELLDLVEDIDMGDLGFSVDIDDLQNKWEAGNGESNNTSEKSYSIVYEIAFNNEEEQQEWYEILRKLKIKYPDVETIAERILLAFREWDEANG